MSLSQLKDQGQERDETIYGWNDEKEKTKDKRELRVRDPIQPRRVKRVF